MIYIDTVKVKTFLRLINTNRGVSFGVQFPSCDGIQVTWRETESLSSPSPACPANNQHQLASHAREPLCQQLLQAQPGLQLTAAPLDI